MLKNNLKSLFGALNSLSPIQKIIYFSSIIFSWMAFNQGDLNHTIASSYAYLQGHASDFYDFNKIAVGGNDYLPLLYVIFALWMSPLKIFGLTSSDSGDQVLNISPLEIIWGKGLLALFFLISCLILIKIANEIRDRSESNKIFPILFLTSPFAVFAIFIFSQYDVLGIPFTLLGIYYLLKNDYAKFALFFGIAISFKFFAAVIFLPLLLLANVRYLEKLKFGVIACIPVLLQLVIYWPNEAFRSHIFNLAQGKATSASKDPLSLAWTIMCVILYLVVCAVAARAMKRNRTFELPLFIAAASFGIMYSAVIWHPQWLVIIVPFLAFVVGTTVRLKTWIFAESIAFVIFIVFVVNVWKQNVDATMLERGPLKEIIEGHSLLLSDVMPGWPPILFYLLKSLFLVPFLYLLWRVKNPVVDTRDNQYLAHISSALTVRIASPLLIFIIPAVFVTLVPVNVATLINADAALVEMSKQETGSIAQAPVGEIVQGIEVRQSFTASEDNLAAVGILLATYARSNSNQTSVQVQDESGQVLFVSEFDASKVADNEYKNFIFPAIEDSKNRVFTIVISSLDGIPGNAITAWASSQDNYLAGKLSYGNLPITGDLVFSIFYQRDN